MIQFRPLLPDEFPAYRSYFVPDYALDLATNSGLTLEQAHLRAAQDLDEAFCDGPATQGQHLLCILGPQGLLGYLWYEIQTLGAAAFLLDFHILPPFQGRGHGKVALSAFEDRVRAEGCTQILLRVAPDNAAALRVYQGAGFAVSGIKMFKPLTGP